MSQAVSTPPAAIGYDEDLVLWADEQARLLRERRLDQLDVTHLMAEVEGVSAAQRAAVEGCLVKLIAQLLAWKYQPGARSGSWRDAIDRQRTRIVRLIDRSPSLSLHPAAIFDQCYLQGRRRAAAETGIDRVLLPVSAPFTLAEAMDSGVLPTEPDLEAYN